LRRRNFRTVDDSILVEPELNVVSQAEDEYVNVANDEVNVNSVSTLVFAIAKAKLQAIAKEFDSVATIDDPVDD